MSKDIADKFHKRIEEERLDIAALRNENKTRSKRVGYDIEPPHPKKDVHFSVIRRKDGTITTTSYDENGHVAN